MAKEFKIRRLDIYNEYLLLKRNVHRFPSLQPLVDSFPKEGVGPEEQMIRGSVDAIESLLHVLIDREFDYDFMTFTDPDSNGFVHVIFDEDPSVRSVAFDNPKKMLVEVGGLMHSDPAFEIFKYKSDELGVKIVDNKKDLAHQAVIEDEPAVAAELVLYLLNEIFQRNPDQLIHVQIGW